MITKTLQYFVNLPMAEFEESQANSGLPIEKKPMKLYFSPPNIAGLNGRISSPKVEPSQFIFCFRHMVFRFTKTVFIYGIEGYQYEAVPELFDNGTSNSENQCFCAGDCVPSGALNCSACRLGTPSFASFPHYYLSDPWYRDAVEGMKPDPEKHKVYLVLEPVSLKTK